MRWFEAVILAMLVWGNSAFAALPTGSDERSELQTITSWMAYLDQNYSDLEVSTNVDMHDQNAREGLLMELELLHGFLHYDYDLPDGSLKQIACGKPVCDGGGGGGKCKMCSVGDE